jgi:hypothetical protein
VYATSKGWDVVIPVESWLGGITSAILIGAVAGLMPAVRASRSRQPRHCERFERDSDLYQEASLPAGRWACALTDFAERRRLVAACSRADQTPP